MIPKPLVEEKSYEYSDLKKNPPDKSAEISSLILLE